ncbi:hypothetical protein KY284_029786 [Solanum tuberosum]|nr:hypothetical protein KY284_029786 [Solanum tuberosum]
MKKERLRCTILSSISDMVKTQSSHIFVQLSSQHSNDTPAGNRTQNVTIDAPMIVTHFTNADLELSPSSTFAQV